MSKRPPPPPPKKPSHLSSVAFPAQRPKAPTPAKRGLGWPWDYAAERFSLYPPSAPISWLFNWELWRPPGIPQHIEWVPCIRTAAEIGDLVPFLTDITMHQGVKVTALLGFNEPEVPSQANLGVGNAVRLWKNNVLPAKQRFNVRLGSPGMSSDISKSKSWLNSFLHHLGNDHGIDFLVLHWYGVDFADLRSFLEDMHSTYNLPIWLNEFACSTMGGDEVSKEDVEAFLKEAVEWLEGCEWVERYAYFGHGQRGTVGDWVGRENGFCEGKEDRLTEVGKLYLEL
ncbi:hypothetical protein NX059_011678 [Plenodomus lindquistii]|nr:hypothetical protein NX059_011678 [Plenodomus lindquistii]